MDVAALEARLAKLPVAQYAFFRTGELTFSERVRTVCERECPRYGKSWACPPAVGSVAACRARCLSYPDGLLIVTPAEVADPHDMAQTLATVPAHEALTREVEALLKAQGCAVLTLSAQSCTLCETCTCPADPCRHPELMFPCVESHGILVMPLADKYGIEYAFGSNIISWFSLLLYR